jgi:glycerate 2-kinase
MIVIAPTALKGTISARAAARALAAGIRSLGCTDVIELPVSDGGPGLIDALASDDAQLEQVPVQGPLGRETDARLLKRSDATVIESADACGLHLVKPQDREPLRASTYGVGQLLRAAEQRSSQHIVVGLGGSATMDAGIGMAAALGWRFTDPAGEELSPLPAALETVAHVVPPTTPWSIPVTALADVRTTLYGPHGAARVFGPQKGATPAVIEHIDRGFERLARISEADLGVSFGNEPGDGAAGGLGAALRVFLSGRIISGSEWVLQQIELDKWLAQARLLVTAEGSFDRQSALGKITGVLIERARERGVPVLLIAGRVEGQLPTGVDAVTAAAGAQLSTDDLARLARAACAELLAM